MSISDQRIELIKSILEDETLAAEEDEILHILLNERVAQNTEASENEKLTFGQKSADAVAKFAGSWAFIIAFFCVLIAWITVNAVMLARPFDAYPFILLNLILSCIAAIQAPVILMSKNRQEEKDRIRAKNDYKVNLKAEIIIEDIHQKLDSIIDKLQELEERKQKDVDKG
jgi:uncharacterized membrane protein